jgi:hypothetical protein
MTAVERVSCRKRDGATIGYLGRQSWRPMALRFPSARGHGHSRARGGDCGRLCQCWRARLRAASTVFRSWSWSWSLPPQPPWLTKVGPDALRGAGQNQRRFPGQATSESKQFARIRPPGGLSLLSQETDKEKIEAEVGLPSHSPPQPTTEEVTESAHSVRTVMIR